jgi:hypothetical protein
MNFWVWRALGGAAWQIWKERDQGPVRRVEKPEPEGNLLCGFLFMIFGLGLSAWLLLSFPRFLAELVFLSGLESRPL